MVPKGVELEQPLAIRIVNGVEGGALFFRLLVIAEPESRFSLIEDYASASPELSGYTPEDPSDLWAGDNVVGIDTCCGNGGFLTAFELPALNVYESR